MCSAGIALPAQAQSSVGGTIGVSLTVEEACLVNGSAVSTTLGTVGTIGFGSQPGTFTTADATLAPSGGGSAITVQCSPGAQPTLTVGTGANDNGGVRRVADGAGNFIPYRLYTAPTRAAAEEIGIGEDFALGTMGTTAVDFSIYATATNGSPAAVAGSYQDTVQVTLSW